MHSYAMHNRLAFVMEQYFGILPLSRSKGIPLNNAFYNSKFRNKY